MWLRGILIILSYLIGCFNTGYYYVRFVYKTDVRSVGSSVTGAYNVSKIGGKMGFVITFVGDALKGTFVVLLCHLLKLEDSITMTCILMVILGHIVPFQLKFRGGKGLSTAFGALIAFHPLWIIYWIIIAILLLPLIRRYTISCLFALLLLPLAVFIENYSMKMVVFMLLYAVVISIACRDNLKDYLNTRAYNGWNKDKK